MYPVFNLKSSVRFARRFYYPVMRPAPSGRPMTMIAYVRSVILHERSFWWSSRLAQQFVLDCWSRNEQIMVQYWKRPAFQQKLRSALARMLGGRNLSAQHTKIYMPSSYAGSSRYCQRNYHDAQFIAANEGSCHLFITMTANPHWAEVRELLPEGQGPCDRPDIIARVFAYKVSQLLLRLNTAGYLHPAHLGASWIVYTIEWQQGGLPHVHLAVRLLLDDILAPMTTTHDQLRFMREIISAKMPPPGTTEYHLVRTFMVHGHPCTHCVRRRKDGTNGCKFYFPKTPSDVSRVDNKGFPVYERSPDDIWVVPHILKFLKEFQCHFNTEWTLSSQCIGYLFKYINKGVDSSGVKLCHQLDEIAAFRAARVLSVSEAIWRILGFIINYKVPHVVLCKLRLPALRAEDCERDVAESVMRADIDREFDLPPPPDFDADLCPPDDLDMVGGGDDNDQQQDEQQDDEAEAGTGIPDRSDIWKDDLSRYFMRVKDLEMTFTVFYQWWYCPPKRDIPRDWRARDDFYDDAGGTIWKKRRAPILARMPWVPPRHGELHYLRILLHHIPAAGFDDLLAGHRTFRESAIAHSLVQTDKEALYVMRDAKSMGFTGDNLRRLFCSLIASTDGTPDIWGDDDIRRALKKDFEPSEARGEMWPIECADLLCVMELCVLFASLERGDLISQLERLNLPAVPKTHGDLLHFSTQFPDGYALLRKFGELIGVDIRRRVALPQHETEIRAYQSKANEEYTDDELALRVASLNQGQRAVYDVMTQMVLQPDSPNTTTLLHVDAPAGCGKTYVCSTFAAVMRRQGHVVLSCASTGIAAINFYMGRTVHSLFSIPIDKDVDVVDGSVLESTLFKVLRRLTRPTNARIELLRLCRVIILDEISMLNREVLRAVDELLRAITHNPRPFGGKIIITLGDFRQICPPSANDPSRTLTTDTDVFAASSYACSVLSLPVWRQFRQMKLVENERARNDGEFHAAIMSVGDGATKIYPVHPAWSTQLFPTSLVLYDAMHAMDWLFGKDSGLAYPYEPHGSSRRCVVCPYNAEAAVLNGIAIHQIVHSSDDPDRRGLRELLSVDEYHLKNDTTIQNGRTYEDGNAIPPPEDLQAEIDAHQSRLVDVDILYADGDAQYDHVPPVFDDNDFVPADAEIPQSADDLSVELLNSMEFSGVPSHKIQLCPGVVVVVIRNLDPSRGIMNGTRMIVESISRSGRVVTLKHPVAPVGERQRYDPNKPFLMHRIKFTCRIGGHGNFMTRMQFPLRIAYAVSIHKSQSLTLDRVVVDLRSGVFEHGQLYVALSRVRMGAHVCFLLREGQENIRNIVHDIFVRALEGTL